MPERSSYSVSQPRKWEHILLPVVTVIAVILTLGLVGYALSTLRAGEFIFSGWPLGVLFIVASLVVAGLGFGGFRLSIQPRGQIFGSSERANLTARFEEAQVNYQSIFNNAVEGIFQSTPEGSLITANPALVRMMGRETAEDLIEEMSGWSARLFFLDDARWAEMIYFIQLNDGVGEFEAEILRKDGSTIWVSQNIHAVRDEQGEILYLEGTILDITQSYWAEKRQRLQYETVKIINDASSVVEARPKILQAICELLEWDMGAVWNVALPENMLRCVEIWHTPGLDIAEFEAATNECSFAPGVRLAGKVWQTGEAAWVVNFSADEFSINASVAAKYGMNSAFGIPIKVGGEVMQVLEFFSPKISEPDRELLQTLGAVASQIGYLIERKLAEEALRDSVVRKAAILESALDCIMTFDYEGKVIEWNPAAERTFGYRRADAIGCPLVDLIIPEATRSTACSGLPLYSATGISLGRRSEIVAKRSNGQEFPAEIAIVKVQVNNRPLYTVYLRDVTEAQYAERLRSELAAVVAASGDAIISKTLDGIITSWNSGAERIYGYTASEMIHRPASLLVAPDHLSGFAQELETIRDGRSIQNYEVQRVRKGGQQICVALTEAPIVNERGIITGIASTERDITEHKRAEGEMIQSYKMEAVGRLAGGVAHDFNNVITAILGYSDILLTEMPPDSDAHKSILEIRKAGEFAASLTHQLLAFSRGQGLKAHLVDVNHVVAGMQPMIRQLSGEAIQMVVSPSGVSSIVSGDLAQLEQVILNLAVNARDAMPNGGVLTISTTNIVLTGENLDSRNGVPEGNWVKLVVRDSGIGMSDAVKRHIFEPFFTTKERGSGTGMGLSTCYGIVKQSKGYIICESVPGFGTKFEIYLPRVEAVSGDSGELIEG